MFFVFYLLFTSLKFLFGFSTSFSSKIILPEWVQVKMHRHIFYIYSFKSLLFKMNQNAHLDGFFHPFSHGHRWDFPVRKGSPAPGLWLQTVRCLSPLPLEVISTWSTTRPDPGCCPGWSFGIFIQPGHFCFFPLKWPWHHDMRWFVLMIWQIDGHLIMKSLDFTSMTSVFFEDLHMISLDLWHFFIGKYDKKWFWTPGFETEAERSRRSHW